MLGCTLAATLGYQAQNIQKGPISQNNAENSKNIAERSWKIKMKHHPLTIYQKHIKHIVYLGCISPPRPRSGCWTYPLARIVRLGLPCFAAAHGLRVVPSPFWEGPLQMPWLFSKRWSSKAGKNAGGVVPVLLLSCFVWPLLHYSSQFLLIHHSSFILSVAYEVCPGSWTDEAEEQTQRNAKETCLPTTF